MWYQQHDQWILMYEFLNESPVMWAGCGGREPGGRKGLDRNLLNLSQSLVERVIGVALYLERIRGQIGSIQHLVDPMSRLTPRVRKRNLCLKRERSSIQSCFLFL